MIKPDIIICRDADDLARKAAEQFVSLASDAVARSGRFTVALSGGSTPRTLYSLLASSDYAKRIDWRRVHLFWGDERCVPPDHADSNYRMVREALLSKIQIPQEKYSPHGGRERASASGGGDANAARYPAGKIILTTGKLMWFITQNAASGLDNV